ncbi:MAG: hypothetical protein ABSB22_05005 [Thermodesulfobacteriota bacterium]|jgi:hypothetical protein
MPEKYKKYILTDLKLPEEQQKTADRYAQRATRILWLDDEVIEGAMYATCAWYWKASDEGENAHAHDFDEIIAFFGSDPQNPHDLGGEVEFWLEDKNTFSPRAFLSLPARG